MRNFSEMEKVCHECGEKFLGKKQSRFCPKCAHERRLIRLRRYDIARRERRGAVAKKCEMCGKDFIGRDNRQIYCSRECYKKARNKRQMLMQKKLRLEDKQQQKEIPRLTKTGDFFGNYENSKKIGMSYGRYMAFYRNKGDWCYKGDVKMKIVQPHVEIVGKLDGVAMLKRIELYGRTCYQSESENNADTAILFVKKLIENGHESVLEHEKITVKIICDRGISHELVRHRLASYTQESTRYVDYNNIEVIEPSGMSGKARSVWEQSMQKCEDDYKTLRELKVPKQIARSVLPTCLKTEVVMTANLRDWRHILALRASRKAHPDMQTIAYMILDKFRLFIPVVFDGIGGE